jgi:hypothetical protein
MTDKEAIKKMYQLLLTEPHAPTVCAQLERIAREALSDHAMQEVQRLGQEIEQEPVPPPWWPAVENILNEYGLQAIDFVADFKNAMAQPEQEPVAYFQPHKGFYWAKPTSISAPTIADVEPLPLYTTPPQRKPLTDDELSDIWFKQSTDWMEFARAIEAAHGIKETT